MLPKGRKRPQNKQKTCLNPPCPDRCKNGPRPTLPSESGCSICDYDMMYAFPLPAMILNLIQKLRQIAPFFMDVPWYHMSGPSSTRSLELLSHQTNVSTYKWNTTSLS